MKIKDGMEKVLAFFVIGVVFIVLLPFLLLYFLYKFFMTPFDYIKYKRSRYQQDYPHKYTWLSTPHMDSKAYEAIKDNNLPVEYIKWSEDYELNGYFIYKDILLNFTEPLFFDKKKGLWLWWPSDNGEDEVSEDDESEDDADYDNTDDCLGVDELKAFILDDFQNHILGRDCRSVVFFYARKSVENNYEKGGLEAMRALDDFIIYEKGELAQAIKQFVETHG